MPAVPHVDGRTLAANVVRRQRPRKRRPKRPVAAFGSLLRKPKMPAGHVETVEEYLARGGRIRRVPMGVVALSDDGEKK